MSSIQNIRKQSITDTVYQQLLDAIASNEWLPGQKIPSENELAAKMGVSRISVRGAIHKLSSQGLIESRQGQGTFVSDMSGEQYMNSLLPEMLISKPRINDLLELRMMIETYSVRLAAGRSGPETIRGLRECLERHRECGGDFTQAAECDLQFHYQIAEATGNPLIIRIYAIVREVFRTMMADIVINMGIKNALFYHDEIIRAIEESDAVRAESVMREHIQNTIDAVLKDKRQSGGNC